MAKLVVLHTPNEGPIAVNLDVVRYMKSFHIDDGVVGTALYFELDHRVVVTEPIERIIK